MDTWRALQRHFHGRLVGVYVHALWGSVVMLVIMITESDAPVVLNILRNK